MDKCVLVDNEVRNFIIECGNNYQGKRRRAEHEFEVVLSQSVCL